MKKWPWKRILVLLVSFAVLIGFILFDPDVKKIDEVIAQMDPVWLLGAFLCVLLYYLGDTVMYLIACRDMQIPQSFPEGLLTTMLGFFYSAVTPLASGGQPFQVIQMRSRGINVGTATSVLMVKFMAWHITLSAIGLVGVILRGGMLIAESTTMFVMFIIGFISHAFCSVTGVLLMIRPDWVSRGGNAVCRFVGRVFFKRRPEMTEKMLMAFDGFVSDYKQAVSFALDHKGGMVLILLTAIVEVSAYISVTYFVYRGLGFSEASFFTLFFMQAMLLISVAFIPLPGAAGASEGGFYAIFTAFFDGARLAGMLLWRVMTYYLTIAIGMVFVLIDGFRKKKREEQA